MDFRVVFSLFFYVGVLTQIHGQQVHGQVFSVTDSSAVEGASVYFDGTTLGTATDATGRFALKGKGQNNPLVISILGYETITLQDPSQLEGKQVLLYLKDGIESLGEVFIENDVLSRKRKLYLFKKEFLGSTKAARRCSIENEEDLELHYSQFRGQLTAQASKPIIVVNKALGYRVRYELQDFNADYGKGYKNPAHSPYNVFYAGTSFFEELQDDRPKRLIRDRDEAYLGSMQHFFRNLAYGDLAKEHFTIFHEKKAVETSQIFGVTIGDGISLVHMFTKEATVLFDNVQQSRIQSTMDFQVDEWGNHYPPQALLVGGTMSTRRIAGLLPLNYIPIEP